MRINMYKRNPKNQGITSIYFTITWIGNRLIYQVGESIHYTDWNSKKYEPKQNANNAPLIGRLAKAEQKIRDAFDKLEIDIGVDKITPKKLKIAIQGGSRAKKVLPEKKEQVLLIDFIKQFIDDTKNGVRLSVKKKDIQQQSIKPYGNVKLAMSEFELEYKRKLYLKDVNQDLLDDFELFLINKKNLAVNTRGKYMQMLMLILKYANKMKLLDRERLMDLKVVVATEDSDSIYLKENEIDAFQEYRNPDNPYLEFINDMFVIGTYSGLRHSDFSRLTEKNFFENRIRTIQKKVGKKVVITIHPMAKKVISKYEAGFPFECPKSTQVFNELIREVAKEIPCLNHDVEKRITKGSKETVIVKKKHEWISSHVCRRSFCTNELLAGTSVELIMAMSGHKSYKSFKSYVKATSEEKADAIERIWDERYKHLKDENEEKL